MDLPMIAAPSAITPAQELNEKFTRLYTQFQPRITRLVLGEVRDGNHALAQDLTQDAFYRAWLGLHKCRATTDGQTYAWLAAIARRAVAEHFRLKKNTSEIPADTTHWRYANRELVPAGAYATLAHHTGGSGPDMGEAFRRVRQGGGR